MRKFDQYRNFSKILLKSTFFKIFENFNQNRNFFPKFDQKRNFSKIWPKSKFFENFTKIELKSTFFEFSKILIKIEIVRKFDQNRNFLENLTKIEILRQFWNYSEVWSKFTKNSDFFGNFENFEKYRFRSNYWKIKILVKFSKN